ncbi:MAG TPA: CocE/NonD family hydrolase [Thermoanaerobaculia bacterium]
MSVRPTFRALIATLALTGVTSCSSSPSPAPAESARPAKVSRFNEYRGWSEAVYDGWVRSSVYVPMRDGTRLAVDIFRPTRNGQVAEEKLPVVWTHHRYQRAVVDEGKLYTILDTFPWLQEVIRHGYVVAAVDARGSGASFGIFEGMFNLRETQDGYDMTEWLAAQPWSNGNIGMYGRSYLGITQYMAASRKPPHLKAIFPEVAMVDMYALLWHGGIFHGPFIENWTKLVREMDVDKPAEPVDEDKDRSLLKAAIEEHKQNFDMAELVAGAPYRDSLAPGTRIKPFVYWTPITYRDEIRKSKVAVYHLAGWFDRYVRDQAVLFRNLDNPQKLTIGPWTHTQNHAMDFAAEHLRWWDFWLKGIPNGVMDDAPVHYYVMGAPEDKAWRSAPTWPLPQERRTPYFFANDRGLGTAAPADPGGQDAFTVDYTATADPNPRWGLSRQVPELTNLGAKGLSYTTPPLPRTVEVTGHPVVHLWASASATDADFFVYLEEVDKTGKSVYVSEGALRASNRAVQEPGYNYLGLPYHRGNRADRQPLTPGEPVELTLDLFPVSNLFDAGHRIRVTITGADKANAVTPEQSPAPTLTIYRGKERASYIELPVIP